MRVLWISNETPDRAGQGGQRRQYFQIKTLVDRGHPVQVITLAGPQDDRSVREQASVRRTSTHLAGRWSRPIGRRRPLVAARSGSVDRVVVAHLESWKLLRGRAGEVRAPVLLDLHNVMSRWYDRRGEPELAAGWRARERAALEQTDAVSVCSGAEAAALPDTGTGRRLVLAHGVDPAEWPAQPAVATRPVVAMFGNWSWEPNAWGLAWFATEVWPRVRAAHPTAVARIAGNGVPAETAALPGIEAVGRVPELTGFLAGAAVLAVPIRTGVGAAVKFAEATASGVAVVATTDAAQAAPGAPAVVSDDPAEWTRHISGCLARPDVAHAAGVKARDYALQNLTWDAVNAPLVDWVETPSAAPAAVTAPGPGHR